MMLMGRVKASGASRIIRAAESASGMSVPEVESVATVTGTLEFFRHNGIDIPALGHSPPQTGVCHLLFHMHPSRICGI